ncbi:MAG: hypothetical protein QXD62_01435 [Candidatus Woesearchaeota archaeon]
MKKNNKMKKRLNGEFFIYFRYLSVAFIFFLFGFYFGYNSNILNSEKIALMLKSASLKNDILNLQLSFYYSSLFNCSIASSLINEFENEVSALGRTLQTMDEKNMKGEYYYLLKERYHLYQIRLYLMYKTFLEVCNRKKNIILYFWGLNNESLIQGQILDSLVSEIPEIKVFAVQKGFSEVYTFLEKYYNVNITPTIIVNYQFKFENITSKEIIKSVLEEVSNE